MLMCCMNACPLEIDVHKGQGKVTVLVIQLRAPPTLYSSLNPFGWDLDRDSCKLLARPVCQDEVAAIPLGALPALQGADTPLCYRADPRASCPTPVNHCLTSVYVCICP